MSVAMTVRQKASGLEVSARAALDRPMGLTHSTGSTALNTNSEHPPASPPAGTTSSAATAFGPQGGIAATPVYKDALRRLDEVTASTSVPHGPAVVGRYLSAETITLTNPRTGERKIIARLIVDLGHSADAPRLERLHALADLPAIIPGALYFWPVIDTVDAETSTIVRVLRPDVSILLIRDDSS